MTVDEVFDAAVDVPEAEREAFLRGACNGDETLLRKVKALLKAHNRPSHFLDRPPAGERPEAGPVAPIGEQVGDQIGCYTLLQKIGEGGCGVVFMAEQEAPVRRRVALKVVKPGMDSKNVIARFEVERQALALMDHPNIAHVFDAGTTGSGRPYFVMELICGIKITDYCDQNSLTTIQRLELFTEVCNAVQHAHQKGIIHRDIKPSNILVTTSAEGKPVPKVIDFGIAKATTGQRLTDNTVFTAFEMLIGTPAYMSPEQAAMTNVDVDTRTDIYSLGVLLYELVTGTTPFDTQGLLKVGLDEVRRVIREQEPVRPSTRLRTMLATDMTPLARRRKADAPKLIRAVRGDLDWIVMMALEKDRARRYQTVNGLALDIQRYLANEPVLARPPSSLYKLQKAIVRNKLLFAGLSIILSLLISGLATTSWLLAQEKQAHRETDAARKKAEINEQKALLAAAKNRQVTQFFVEMLQSVGPSVAKGRDTTLLREILDRTAERVGQELTNQPAVEADLRSTIGYVYLKLGFYDKAEAMQRMALSIYQRLPDRPDREISGVLYDLATVHRTQFKLDEAEKEMREALAIATKLDGDENLLVAAMESEMALIVANQGHPAAAAVLYRKALATARRLAGDHAQLTMECINGLTMVLQMQGQWAEAEVLLRGALPQAAKMYGSNSLSVAAMDFSLANVLDWESNQPEAVQFCRECVAIRRQMMTSDNPHYQMALATLGSLLQKEKKWADAEEIYTELLAIRRKQYQNEDLRVLETFVSLEEALAAQHKDTEGDRLFNELLAAISDSSTQAGRLWQTRAIILARYARWKEAAAAATHALKILPDDPDCYHLLAPMLVETGNRVAYEKLCGEITAHFRGATNASVADRMAKDCLILPWPGADLEVAGELADTAVSSRKGAPPIAFFECCKALAEYRQGHDDAAIKWAKAAGKTSFPYSQAEAYAILAMAECKLKQNEDAQRALAECSEIVETQMPKMDSGDLGGDWRDLIIAHALLTEAKSMIQGPGLPANISTEK